MKRLAYGVFFALAALTIVAGVVHARQVGTSPGPWQFFDNLTKAWVPVKACGIPHIKYYTFTLAPNTPAGTSPLVDLSQFIIPFDSTQQIVLDGGEIHASPGGIGTATVLTGDDLACTTNQHELATVNISSFGASFFTRPALAGQFICLHITGTPANGGITYHLQSAQ